MLRTRSNLAFPLVLICTGSTVEAAVCASVNRMVARCGTKALSLAVSTMPKESLRTESSSSVHGFSEIFGYSSLKTGSKWYQPLLRRHAALLNDLLLDFFV